MKRVRIIVSGDVQGVGYRSWAKGKAKELGLSGWVKNRDDGAVEIVAEGSKSKLEEMIVLCQKGPEVAWVKEVIVEWEKAVGEFVVFEVVY